MGILCPAFDCPSQHSMAPLHSCKAFLVLLISGSESPSVSGDIEDTEDLVGLPCRDAIAFGVLQHSMGILCPVFDCPPQHSMAPLHSCKAFLVLLISGSEFLLPSGDIEDTEEFVGLPCRDAIAFGVL